MSCADSFELVQNLIDVPKKQKVPHMFQNYFGGAVVNRLRLHYGCDFLLMTKKCIVEAILLFFFSVGEKFT
jgi:hypothetical protein